MPTGLEVRGRTVYMAEAGPVPHVPETGKVLSFTGKSPTTTEVASGASLLVDVEFGRGNVLYALSQGPHAPGTPEGAPAAPNTGSLVRVAADGTLPVIVSGLDRPTSFEFIGDTAYVVTFTGQVWRIDNVSPHSPKCHSKRCRHAKRAASCPTWWGKPWCRTGRWGTAASRASR